MTAELVDAAIANIRRRDPTLADDAQMAADGLTAGEGLDMLWQASVQEWLWWQLPRRFPPEDWYRVAGAAEVLFEELGMTGYADIARSDTTAEILSARRVDAAGADDLARAAEERSGVRPPDTELLAWGTVWGTSENRARGDVERELEFAIRAEFFTPGRRSWRKRAASIADQTLTDARPDLLGQTLLNEVTTERVSRWVAAARSDEDRRRRNALGSMLVSEVSPPADIDGVVAPMRWLLEHAAEEIPLTQSNYIARSLVVDAADRFGWWDWDKPPQSEVDVYQLMVLRARATDYRLVRRRGRLLVATKRGRELLTDDVGLWRAVVRTLGGKKDFEEAIAEFVSIRLVAGPVFGDDLYHEVTRLLTESGWKIGGEDPQWADVRGRVAECLYWWRALGLLDEERPRWDGAQLVGKTSTGLTEAGRATVLAFLRLRAIRPRHTPYD